MTAPIEPRAAILLIGDELLSAKVRDENGYFLAQTLRRCGIELTEVCTVGDDASQIAGALHRQLKSVPLVFTSGGVGPTHDDLTLAAIAQALERPLERSTEMEAVLRGSYGEPVPAAALRMADLPRGTRLRAEPGWPVLRVDVDRGAAPVEAPHDARIYILPGIPGLFRAKIDALEALDGELPRGVPLALRSFRCRVEESEIASQLSRIVAEFPDVQIGSYPRWLADDDGRLRSELRITFEAKVSSRAEAARAAFAECVPSHAHLSDESLR